jgi:hypothetical protein
MLLMMGIFPQHSVKRQFKHVVAGEQRGGMDVDEARFRQAPVGLVWATRDSHMCDAA